jgi:hypothetical protein
MTESHDLTPSPRPEGTLPPAILGGLILLVLLGVLFYFTRNVPLLFWMVSRAAVEFATAGAIVLAAGGYTWPLVRKLAPEKTDRMFLAVTAAALGLALWGSVLMILGSLVPVVLTTWTWWVVLVGGIGLCAFWARGAVLGKTLPTKLDPGAIVWVLVAAAGALWLLAALQPPGIFGSAHGDAYDVLEYHLQVPREFYNHGRVHALEHNVYSFYPLGVEMLFLLGMLLRGGGYEGMYLAQFLPGIFVVLTAAAVIVVFRGRNSMRGRISAALLVTPPAVVYLAGLAFAETAMICYLMLAVLWLREWMRDGRAGTAGLIGLLLGAACCMKYLSIMFIAAPVLLVMLPLGLAQPRRFAHLGLAGVLCLLMFAPWLVRNVIHTGNPVFPLATSVLGQGHWTETSAERWRAGHTAESHAPVPEPPGWKVPEPGNSFVPLWSVVNWFGHVFLIASGLSICALLSMRNTLRNHSWLWCLLGVAVLQATSWALLTRDMPWRFLVPMVVPLAILTGWGLEILAGVKTNPLRRVPPARQTGEPPWGRTAAIVVSAAILLPNLIGSVVAVRSTLPMRLGPTGEPEVVPYPPLGFAEYKNFLRFQPSPGMALALPEDARVLVVGDAQGFYYPQATIYSTVFDAQPLAELADAVRDGKTTLAEVRDHLTEKGISHIMVNWFELWRLGGTYGIPRVYSEQLWTKRAAPPSLDILSELGAKPVPIDVIFPEDLPVPHFPWEPRPIRTDKTMAQWLPFRPPAHWPIYTLYALPPANAAPDWVPTPIRIDVSEGRAASDTPPAETQPTEEAAAP